MAFRGIPYKKYQEIYKAAKNGDHKAQNIIDKYMEDEIDFDAIERLLGDFYKVEEEPVHEEIHEEIHEEPVCEQCEEHCDPIPAGEQITPEEAVEDSPIPVEDNEEVEKKNDDPIVDEPIVDAATLIDEAPVVEVKDITEDLDKELKDLIDDADGEDGFADMWEYVKDKRKNALRAKKDNAYFKAFDEGGRLKYISDKEKAYGEGQGGKRKKLDRAFRDMDGALAGYATFVGDFPEDEVEFDPLGSEGAYNDIVDDEGIVGAFGRGWDEEDNEAVKQALLLLMEKYGKKNVVAALNTLKSDNKAFYDIGLGNLDEKAKKYGKSLESLLK